MLGINSDKAQENMASSSKEHSSELLRNTQYQECYVPDLFQKTYYNAQVFS